MQYKKIIIIVTVFLLLLLVGCSADNEQQTNDIVNSSETAETQPKADASETTSEAQSVEETLPIKKESKLEIPGLPDDFLEFSKYVGQDISIFGVDTSNWDFDAYSLEIGHASMLEISGAVSIDIGWDNKTVTDLFLHFDNEYLNDDKYNETCSKLEEQFGKPVFSDKVQGITHYKINEDILFSLTRSSMCIGWNEQNRTRFENAKPADAAHNDAKPQKSAPAIGMTAEEVRNSSWGKPSDINKTTTAYGVHEQWVYSGNRYIYFDDGIVTSIQE